MYTFIHHEGRTYRPTARQTDYRSTIKAIQKKMSRLIIYLMEYAFTFTFASREFPPYRALSMTSLICLVTLTFDLLTSKYIHWLLVWWTSITPILGFLGLSVLELGRGTRQTDRRTDRHRPSFHNVLPMKVGEIIIIIIFKTSRLKNV